MSRNTLQVRQAEQRFASGIEEQTIPLSRPDLTEAEAQEVLSVMRTTILSMGPKLLEFEERMAALLQVRFAVAVSSGTCGLHLALRAASVAPGTEVITTPFSFIASANALLFEQAYPAFVDVDPGTLNLSPQSAREAIECAYKVTPQGLINRHTGRTLAGLLPVDVFGLPVDIDGFRALADEYQLFLIEDACEAVGSEVWSGDLARWVPAGRLADAAVYAFYPNKQMTTGEGGLIATNDEKLATHCRTGRNQGRDIGSTWLEHAELGYNYRMDEMSAALGVAQLKRFDEMRGRRAQVAGWYGEALAGLPGLTLPTAPAWARVNWFVYVVRLAPEINRAELSKFLAGRGIETRVYFPPIHLQPLYQRKFGYQEGAYPICETVAASTLALPFFNTMTRDQVDTVARGLGKGVEACAKTRSV